MPIHETGAILRQWSLNEQCYRFFETFVRQLTLNFNYEHSKFDLMHFFRTSILAWFRFFLFLSSENDDPGRQIFESI